MKRLILLGVLAACLLDCKPKSGSSGAQTSATATSTAASQKDKSLAEKAGDAALRARKKAEALKEEQDKKAKETDAVTDQ